MVTIMSVDTTTLSTRKEEQYYKIQENILASGTVGMAPSVNDTLRRFVSDGMGMMDSKMYLAQQSVNPNSPVIQMLQLSCQDQLDNIHSSMF